MEEQCCWLCESDVSKGTFKVKRRKIHGEAVKKHLSILENLADEYLNANLGNETGFLKAGYLCHKCVGTLESLEARRREVFKMEAEVVS